MDPADDWLDTNGTVHPIDGVDIWGALLSGGGVTAARQWLPTTEHAILHDDGAGHMFKLINLEKKANRFFKNGSQYMDMAHPCVNSSIPVSSNGGKSCPVCSPEHPCLFDVIADPREETNLAAQPGMATRVAAMTTKLATFQYYVPALTPENLACYTCGNHVKATSPPRLWWSNFSGPCCVHKDKVAV